METGFFSVRIEIMWGVEGRKEGVMFARFVPRRYVFLVAVSRAIRDDGWYENRGEGKEMDSK